MPRNDSVRSRVAEEAAKRAAPASRARLGSAVDQVRDGELKEDDHQPVAPEEEPDLPVRQPDKVLGVDRERLPVLREDVVHEHPDT